MFRFIIILFTSVTLCLFALHEVLSNGSFINYMDTHPDARWVPATEYYIGQGYYIFHDLTQSATYFIRVPQRYPQSSFADDANFAYVQTLDDNIETPRSTLIQEYQNYLQAFPSGRHVTLVQNRIDSLRSGAR